MRFSRFFFMISLFPRGAALFLLAAAFSAACLASCSDEKRIARERERILLEMPLVMDSIGKCNASIRNHLLNKPQEFVANPTPIPQGSLGREFFRRIKTGEAKAYHDSLHDVNRTPEFLKWRLEETRLLSERRNILSKRDSLRLALDSLSQLGNSR